MYQPTYFIDVLNQGMIKNPKINEIQHVHKKYAQNKFQHTQKNMHKTSFTLKITCYYIKLHLNLK